jgi:hypothetical protein
MNLHPGQLITGHRLGCAARTYLTEPGHPGCRGAPAVARRSPLDHYASPATHASDQGAEQRRSQ